VEHLYNKLTDTLSKNI